MTIEVRFLPLNRTVSARVGEPLLAVAERAGVSIPTGCLMGSCHACEVDLNGEPVCGCITAIPAGPEPVVVELVDDPCW